MNRSGKWVQLNVGNKVVGNKIDICSLKATTTDLDRLPFSVKILLENLIRNEDGRHVTAEHVDALVHWQPQAERSIEFPFQPTRVLLQDFTGVPALVDLASMRETVEALGGDATHVN